MEDDEEQKLRIYINTNVGKKMSRGKFAAHAVHAALLAAGVHPGTPVVVLGAKPRDILKMRTYVRDEGRTELEPGTLTAGTDWVPAPREELEAASQKLREEIEDA
jgi:PTH2 family peptidyl-tRNA hydrolase